MLNEKKDRPAATGTAKYAKSRMISQRYYSIKKLKMQAILFAFVCVVLIKIVLLTERFNPNLIPVEHRVSKGECLWTIAEQYKPDDVPMSIYMEWVYEHNDEGVIYPGDVVVMGIRR